MAIHITTITITVVICSGFPYRSGFGLQIQVAAVAQLRVMEGLYAPLEAIDVNRHRGTLGPFVGILSVLCAGTGRAHVQSANTSSS